MDSDGITVEKVSWDEKIDVESVAVEIASIINMLKLRPELSKFGSINEVTFAHQEFIFIVKIINENYILFYAMRKDGNLGRARFELEKIRFILKNELSVF